MWLYSIVTRVYFFIISLSASFNNKAAQYAAGRRKIFKRIRIAVKDNREPLVWFHCASLGEFEQARPVIEAFRKDYSQHKIFLTFFSPSGYEVRKNFKGADYIFYLPNDSAANAGKLIRLIRPAAALFVKYEYWYFYLRELRRRNIPAICFSAIFRKRQLFFKPYGGFYRNILKLFSQILVQDEESMRLLKSSGITHVAVAGDTRFDRVMEICRNPDSIEIAERFKNGHKVFVMGSVWPADMAVLLPIINDQIIDLKYIVAPHNIHEDEIGDMMRSVKRPCIRFSQATLETVNKAEVLIIDNIGMLSSLYQYGDFAYVGGAFGKGLHNTLEAAAFGMPVLYGAGESVARFMEAVELADEGAAFAIKTTEEARELIIGLLENEEEHEGISRKAADFVNTRTGATALIMKHLKKNLT